MQNLWAIAAGGAAGALCRYGVNVLCVRGLGVHAAWGTLAINAVGSLLLGLVAGTPLGQNLLANAALAIGFLGALTTFSTFSLETVRLLQAGAAGQALANVAANLALGIAGAYAGVRLGRAAYP